MDIEHLGLSVGVAFKGFNAKKQMARFKVQCYLYTRTIFLNVLLYETDQQILS